MKVTSPFHSLLGMVRFLAFGKTMGQKLDYLLFLQTLNKFGCRIIIGRRFNAAVRIFTRRVIRTTIMRTEGRFRVCLHRPRINSFVFYEFDMWSEESTSMPTRALRLILSESDRISFGSAPIATHPWSGISCFGTTMLPPASVNFLTEASSDCTGE